MVSVILPNYNHALYLRERIDSILNQTYRDFELIILDDKSSDNSRDIIEEYRGEERVSNIVYNEDNSGNTFIQWNRGFELAKGEYIWIAESDDFAEPTFLAKCVEQLDANSDAAYCFADSNFVDANSKIISHEFERLVLPTNGESVIKYEGVDFIVNNLLFDNRVYNASMVVFRKSYIALMSDKYRNFRSCGDWLFWAEMAYHGDVVRVAERLNNFRQHSNKVSERAKKDNKATTESIFIILYLIILKYNKEYWLEAKQDAKCVNIHGLTKYIITVAKQIKDKKFKFYILGRLYNLSKKSRHFLSEEERLYVREQIKLTWYAPISGFLIKNSKSLSRYLVGNNKI